MENLDPATVGTQQAVVSEIFKLALTSNEYDVTLATLLQSYDRTIGKHGISASDLAGIQIYRTLLHWSRQPNRSRQINPQRSDAVFDAALQLLQPLHSTPEKTSKPGKSANVERPGYNVIIEEDKLGRSQQVHNLEENAKQIIAHRPDAIDGGFNNPRAPEAVSLLPSSHRSRSSSPTPYFPEWTPLAFPARAPSPTSRNLGSRQSSSRTREIRSISQSRSPSPPLVSDFPVRGAAGFCTAEDQLFQHSQPEFQLAQNSQSNRRQSLSPPKAEDQVFQHSQAESQLAQNDSQSYRRHLSPFKSMNTSSDMTQLPAASSLVAFDMIPEHQYDDLKHDLFLRRAMSSEAFRIDDPNANNALTESLFQMAATPFMCATAPLDDLGASLVADVQSRLQLSSETTYPHSISPSIPLADAASMTETFAPCAQDVLAEAFQYRLVLRHAFRYWQAGVRQHILETRFLKACDGKRNEVAFLAWKQFIARLVNQIDHATHLGEKKRKDMEETLQHAVMTSWQIVSRHRLESRDRFCQVRCKLTLNRLHQWMHAFQRCVARSRGILRLLVLEWRAAASKCRKLRVLSGDFRRQKIEQEQVACLCWLMLMCRKSQAGRELMIQASRHGRRTRLARSLARWQTRSRQEYIGRQMRISTSALARDRARKSALARWRAAVAPCAKFMHSACSFHVARRQRLQRYGLAFWREKCVSKVPGRHIRTYHGKLLKRKLNFAFCCWRSEAGQTLAQRQDFKERLRAQCLQQVWDCLREHHARRQTAQTHKAWADFFWIRSLQRRALLGWRSWLLVDGRVPMMESEAQIMASWHWLRMSSRRSCDDGLKLSARPFASHWFGEVPPRRSALTDAIAELLWGSVSFSVHPHRLEAWRWPLLTIFARALSRRLFKQWQKEMRACRSFRILRSSAIRRLVIQGWQHIIVKRRHCAILEASFADQLQINRRLKIFSGWHAKARSKENLRLHLHEFVLATCVRILRRAVVAWCLACSRQQRVLAVGQDLLAKTSSQLQAIAFHAIVCYWQQSQQSNIFVRLSALYLRKCSLIRGVQGLKAHGRDRAALRSRCQARRSAMQFSWLQQWHKLHLIRKDLSRRTAAARNWAHAKLKLLTWFAWFTWLRAMQSERHRIMIYSRARSSRIASCRLRDWYQQVLQHGKTRKQIDIARQAKRGKRQSSALSSWRARALRRGRIKLRKRLLASQLLEEAMVVWKKCVQAGRTFYTNCADAIIVQRLKFIVAAWRREVLLSHLVQDVFRSRARQRLRQVLLTFRSRTHQSRVVRKAQHIAQGRRRTNVTRLCISGWIDVVRQKGCWRICVEAMLATLRNHLARNCMQAWWRYASFSQEVRRKGATLSVGIRSAIMARCFAKCKRQALVSEQIGKASQVRKSEVLKRCCLAWCQVSKLRGRCHRNSAQLQNSFKHQRRQSLMHYWQTRNQELKHVRVILMKFLGIIARRRMEASFVAWRLLHRHLQSLKFRIANNIMRRQQEIKKRALRCLALWCVHCTECDDGLTRIALAVTRSFLKASFQSWASAVARRHGIEEMVRATMLRRCSDISRVVFISWAAETLMQQRHRSLNAMGEHYMTRCITSKTWLAWLRSVRKEGALRTKEASVRRHKLERLQMNMWAVWRCRIAERWVLGERRQEAAQNQRRARLRKALASWFKSSHSQRLVRQAFIVNADRHGWNIVNHFQVSSIAPEAPSNSVDSALRPSHSASILTLAQFYGNRSCQAASFRSWHAMTNERKAHTESLEILLNGVLFEKSVDLQKCCSRAWKEFTEKEIASREHKLDQVPLQLARKYFQPWHSVTKQIHQALARLRQRQRIQGTNIFGLVMHHWVGHVLSRRSLHLLADGLRQKCSNRHAGTTLRAWSDEYALQRKACSARKQVLRHRLHSKLRAWSSEQCLRKKVREFQKTLHMRRSQSKFRSWFYEMSLRRKYREVRQKTRFEEARCVVAIWRRICMQSKMQTLLRSILDGWSHLARSEVMIRTATFRLLSVVTRNLTTKTLSGWSLWARSQVAVRTATLQLLSVVNRNLAAKTFAGWGLWASLQVTVRTSTLRLLTVLTRNLAIKTFSGWVSIARMLADLETRHRLRADELRRRRRSILCMSVISAWHQETARALLDAERTLASKVLICWHLHAQEQILLRRYLSECSVAGFRGFGGGASSSGYGVREADFQNLYEQMAAHRWDLANVLSD